MVNKHSSMVITFSRGI